MPEHYFSLALGNNKRLNLAPLTDRLIAQSGQTVPNARGYYLFESSGDVENPEVEILAHAMSDEAALRLKEILRLE